MCSRMGSTGRLGTRLLTRSVAGGRRRGRGLGAARGTRRHRRRRSWGLGELVDLITVGCLGSLGVRIRAVPLAARLRMVRRAARRVMVPRAAHLLMGFAVLVGLVVSADRVVWCRGVGCSSTTFAVVSSAHRALLTQFDIRFLQVLPPVHRVSDRMCGLSIIPIEYTRSNSDYVR